MLMLFKMDKISQSRRYCKVRKRKTRKCLNELRKRSSGIFTENHIPKDPAQTINQHLPSIGMIGDCINITKNRLTVKHGIFAKGVRSKTISRADLSEEFKARMDGDLLKIIDLANGKPSHTVTSCILRENSNTAEENKVDTILKSNNMNMTPTIVTRHDIFSSNINEHCIEKMNHINENIEQESPERSNMNDIVSPLYFTPKHKELKSTVESNSHNSDKEIYIRIESSSDSDTDVIGHYELYKKFNDMMPFYINAQFKIATNDNTYENSKDYLKQIYTKSCQRENEENILDCIMNRSARTDGKQYKDNKRENAGAIILNPIQYLKVNQYNNERGHDIPEKKQNLFDGNLFLNNAQSLTQTNKYFDSIKFNENHLTIHFDGNILQDNTFSDRYMTSNSIHQHSSTKFNFSTGIERNHSSILNDSVNSFMNSSRSSCDLANDSDNQECNILKLVSDSPQRTYVPRRMNKM